MRVDGLEKAIDDYLCLTTSPMIDRQSRRLNQWSAASILRDGLRSSPRCYWVLARMAQTNEPITTKQLLVMAHCDGDDYLELSDISSIMRVLFRKRVAFIDRERLPIRICHHGYRYWLTDLGRAVMACEVEETA